MGVLHDFRCYGHGVFESSEEAPLCPFAGCNTVEKVFLQPAAFRSNRTTRIDQRVEGLAKTHGLTDISNRGGRAAIRAKPVDPRQVEYSKMIRDRYGDKPWGALPKGGAAAAVAQFHGQPDNALAQVKEAGALIPRPVDKHVVREERKITPTGDIVSA